MENKITNIKDRVVQIAEKQPISKEKFFSDIGMTSANFRGVANSRPLNSKAIEIIITKYREINPEWLLTGKGEMIKSKTAEPAGKINGIPLIPIEAMAGFGTGEMQVMDYETDRYIVPEFDELKVEFMIRVKGSSMYPKYNSGDIIACKRLPLDTFFQWNKVYVLDTIQGAIIKRIHKSENEETILCVSDNEKYQPFELHKSDLYSLAIVLGVIRLE